MSKSKNKAFTLLEVMLAVSILSIGLVAVVRSYTTSLHALRVSKDYLVANLLLEEKIWQKQEEKIRLGGVMPEDQDDKFNSPFDNFSYKINFEEEGDLPLLYKSTFEVSWQKRNQKRSTSCLLYLPGKEE